MTDVNTDTAIAASLVAQDFEAVIEQVRDAVADHPAKALASPVIKDWLGRRYRNLFLAEALEDKRAMRAAANRVPLPMQFVDRRSNTELLSSRFLHRAAREEAVVEMPAAAMPEVSSDTAIVFAPGMMTGLLPTMAFQSVWPEIEDRFGIRVLTSDLHPARSSKDNVEDLANTFTSGSGLDSESMEIPSEEARAPRRAVLIGYDKGATDCLQFLVDRPEFADRVEAFVSWGGVIGGSYIADDIAANLPASSANDPLSGDTGRVLRQLVPVVQTDQIDRRLDEYDVAAAVNDLTTGVREAFLRDHVTRLMELKVPMFSVSGVTSVREVPYYQALGLLQLRNYDKNNDMLLTAAQARIPTPQATELAMFRAHHWDLAYDPFPWYTRMGSLNVDHKFARLPAMAALVLLLAEIGLLA